MVNQPDWSRGQDSGQRRLTGELVNSPLPWPKLHSLAQPKRTWVPRASGSLLCHFLVTQNGPGQVRMGGAGREKADQGREHSWSQGSLWSQGLSQFPSRWAPACPGPTPGDTGSRLWESLKGLHPEANP